MFMFRFVIVIVGADARLHMLLTLQIATDTSIAADAPYAADTPMLLTLQYC